jgi:hypothetical protein
MPMETKQLLQTFKAKRQHHSFNLLPRIIEFDIIYCVAFVQTDLVAVFIPSTGGLCMGVPR